MLLHVVLDLFLPHYITEEEEKIIYDLCVKIDKFSYENNKNDDDENVYEDEDEDEDE